MEARTILHPNRRGKIHEQSRLPKEHELNLLKKLSTDDAYRARYEKSPTDALKEIGVSDAHISALDQAGLKPGKLAAKADIADAHKKLAMQISVIMFV